MRESACGGSKQEDRSNNIFFIVEKLFGHFGLEQKLPVQQASALSIALCPSGSMYEACSLFIILERLNQ